MTIPQVSCKTNFFLSLFAMTSCCGWAIFDPTSAAASTFSCSNYGAPAECNTLYTLNQDGSITQQTLNSTSYPSPLGGGGLQLVGFYNDSQNKVVDRISLTGTGLIPYITSSYCGINDICPYLTPASKTTTSESLLNISSAVTSVRYAYIPVQSSNILGLNNTTSSSTDLILSSQLGIGSGVGLLPGQGTYISVGLKPEALDPMVRPIPEQTVHLSPAEKKAYEKNGAYSEEVGNRVMASGALIYLTRR
jgi:hypothetical protein